MISFNENLKKISLIEVLLVIILSYLLIFSLNFFQIVTLDNNIMNLLILLFFVVKLRGSLSELKSAGSGVFSAISFREILVLVLLNILFSYGMLYLSNYILHSIPLDGHLSFLIPSKSINNNFAGIFSLISVVLISPLSEELLFRGIFLNKLKLVVPVMFAVMISSLLFASLHGFGGIISAFVFGMCMAILYLKTDNILVPILAHFINNLLSEVIYHLDYLDLLFANDIVMVFVSGLAIVSFVILFKFIKINLKNIY